MAVFSVSGKKMLLRGFISFCAALAAAALMNRILSGPRLGPRYDRLMAFRPPPPVSREILIIDTGTEGPVLSAGGNIVHPLAAANLITALIEMDAGCLIIQAPVLGVSAAGNEEELLLRFDEEYELLGRNIRNLFEAIRLGFIAPEEADRYVGDLISLSGRGKERLIAALVRQDEAGIRRFEDAAARFGRVIIPGDLRIRVNRSAAGNGPGPGGAAFAGGDAALPPAAWIYSRAGPDPDGVLRRIAPALRGPGGEAEHAVYAALKAVPGERRGFGIVYTEFGPALSYRIFPSPLSGETGEAEERLIPLDRGGAVLIEKPGAGALRKIPLADLLAYEETDRELRRMLGEAEEQGIYRGLDPGAYPVALYDHALSLREALIGEGGDRGAWVEARRRYFRALDRFFADTPDEAGGAAADLRARYVQLAELRTRLEEALASSFCILGPAPSYEEGPPADGEGPAGPGRGGYGPGALGLTAGVYSPDAGASAILANSIITGRSIVPGADRYIFFWSLGAALLLLILIRRTGPLLSLGIGTGFFLLTGTAFSLSFIFSAYWIDPLIPLAACAAGTGASVCCALFVRESAAGRIRSAYGAHVSPEYLKALVRRRRPLPSETVPAESAIVAVKNPGPVPRRDPLAASAESARFRDRVFDRFSRAGGVLSGFEGDLIFIAFGSPLERSALLGMRLSFGESFAVKAAGFIFDLLRDSPEAASWRFGVDIGECAFSYSPASGYRASGYPVIRSRILANLASRYNAQALVTRAVSEKLDTMPVRKLDVLADQESGEKEMFYELLVKRRNGGEDI
ncbi:MAG: hypothetical protein LBO80_01625 [Treponema sp.]|jgi:hypothetical protein|nr:hypothetical protein [Treponema sp.]